MAYDLLYKKQIPVNFSAHPSSEPSLNPQTAATLAALAVACIKAVLTKTGREVEKLHYQRELRPGHHPTVEVPAIPMRELVRDFDYGSD